MCSVRQRPIPSAPNSRARAASSGVSAFARTFRRRSCVGPAEHRLEVLVQLRRHERHLADEDAAGAAVDRDHVAFASSVAADARDAVAELEALAAGDARLAHPARDDRRMRGHAAVHGEDSLRRDHPVDVVRRRLEATRITGPSRRARPPCRRRRRSRRWPRPGYAFRPRAAALERRPAGRSSDAAAGRAAPDRCATTASSREISPSSTMSTAAFSAAAAVRFAERVWSMYSVLVLDRELDVLHVAVVLLELAHRLEQLRRTPRQHVGASPRSAAACGSRRRRPRPARSRGTRRRALLAGRRVAREGDAGAGPVALVPEHHLHDVDGRADVVGNLVGAP